mmetsp:Transcript_25196/g.78475  ORF Transcript_25196/g.78475 Transcript_25196/m.78475 type:complete len:559 (+) Transcript_25196:79-1755(+)
MIKYEAGYLGLQFVVQWKGSVFPKAMIWAVPNAVLAVLMHIYARQEQEAYNDLSMTGVNILWAGYTSVLGFLVVFRNNQAYTRFWEGATLINQVRGEWFNAVSTLFAFCNHSAESHQQVETFQNTLIRLVSMLYCSALQQVCALQDDTLEIIDNQGMDLESLSFMQGSNDRCEILLQWIQRLIVDCEESKTLKIAPPLLTRAFQELSRGIVNLNNARKIKDIPFPFPYAQMITVMMIVHWFVTPLLASQVLDSRVAAGFTSFFVTFAFWCLIYIALEIDQPFGDDENDLPLKDMQKDFNQSLLRLMHPLAQKVPTWEGLANPSMKPSLSKSDSTIRATMRVSHVELGEGGEIPENLTFAPMQSGAKPSPRQSMAAGLLNLFGGRHRSTEKGGSEQGCDEAEPPVEPQVLALPMGGSEMDNESFGSNIPPMGPGSNSWKSRTPQENDDVDMGVGTGTTASTRAPRSSGTSLASRNGRSNEARISGRSRGNEGSEQGQWAPSRAGRGGRSAEDAPSPLRVSVQSSLGSGRRQAAAAGEVPSRQPPPAEAEDVESPTLCSW